MTANRSPASAAVALFADCRLLLLNFQTLLLSSGAARVRPVMRWFVVQRLKPSLPGRNVHVLRPQMSEPCSLARGSQKSIPAASANRPSV